jgi:hypothetical protein
MLLLLAIYNRFNDRVGGLRKRLHQPGSASSIETKSNCPIHPLYGSHEFAELVNALTELLCLRLHEATLQHGADDLKPLDWDTCTPQTAVRFAERSNPDANSSDSPFSDRGCFLRGAKVRRKEGGYLEVGALVSTSALFNSICLSSYVGHGFQHGFQYGYWVLSNNWGAE